MSKLIALDDGHGMETAGKRTPTFPDGAVMRENEFNEVVVKYLVADLKRNRFNTLEVAPEITDTALSTRVQRANAGNADLYIAIHANAYGDNWNDANGVETWIYDGVKDGSETHRIGQIIQKHIVAATGLRDRGLKRSATLYVLNSTKMHAVLPELGFMTNMKEATLLRSDEFRKTCAVAICKAVCEFYGITYIESSVTEMIGNKNAIMGEATLSAEQLEAFLLKTNSAPKINCTALELAKHYISEGKAEGVRGDIAFCQAIHETGWFKYSGDVLPEQNNYCGLGATNTTPTGKGAWFDTPQLGVRAQIQHLKAYASKGALANVCIDPRFDKVVRGTALNWEDLGGKWAVPGYAEKQYISFEVAYKANETYGQKIMAIHINATAAQAECPTESTKGVSLIIGGDMLIPKAENINGFWYVTLPDGVKVKIRDIITALGYTSTMWDDISKTIVAVK